MDRSPDILVKELVVGSGSIKSRQSRIPPQHSGLTLLLIPSATSPRWLEVGGESSFVASDCDNVGDMAPLRCTDEWEDSDLWLVISLVEVVDGTTLETCSGNATCWNRDRDAAVNESWCMS